MARTNELVCWKCGGSLKSLPIPLSRMAECPACKAELHTCRLCQYYEAHTTRGCREIRAEDVINKERANYCDWFKARPGAFDASRQGKVEVAKSKLDALFGGDSAPDAGLDAARDAVERLFGDKKKPS
jgi:hypothetical protein